MSVLLRLVVNAVSQSELVCTQSGRIIRHRRQSSADDSSVDLTYEVHFHSFE